MKKALIAGAASVALAAMPVVGVFATEPINGSPIVDRFVVTVEDACTFSRKITSNDAGHPDGATFGDPAAAIGTWSEGTSGNSDSTINTQTIPANSDMDTFNATVIAGNTYNGFAKSKFNVTCNDAIGGYKVTAYTGALTGTAATNPATIPYNAGTSYAASGSSWFLTSDAATVSGANPIVWSHTAFDSNVGTTTKLNSEDFEITYNLQVALDQDVDEYTGSVVYTLTNLN